MITVARVPAIRFAAGAWLALAFTGVVRADADLDNGRALWQRAALTAYEYGYHKFCECHPDSPPETIVSVRNDHVIRVRHRPVGSTVEVPAADKNFEFYWTIDGLFALVESAFERGAQTRVKYDSTLGYPSEIYIDYDANMIGDEVDLRLTTVTPLSP
jgi:hypothetical protein